MFHFQPHYRFGGLTRFSNSAAGTDTTATALANFVLAMTLYPDVVAKGQEQIDSIVGRNRLPTFADREKLPYIDAIVKEVLRWRPIGPTGVPRRTTQVSFPGTCSQ